MKLPWKYILVSDLIGLFIGGSAGLFWSPRIEGHWTKKSGELFLKRLDHELHLSVDQRLQVTTLLTINRGKVTAYQEEIRQEVRTQIRGILTVDQLTKFDDMVARHDAERKAKEGR